MYSGMALRLGTALGLHRAQHTTRGATLGKVQREHRIRLWWTIYIFDRSTSSRLGHPLSIDDIDIETELPSWETLDVHTKEKFNSPEHLVANIELSRITGCIMRDIYGPATKKNPRGLVHNTRSILKRLKQWDASIGPRLRWIPGGTNRGVASLQLHFNQCIILTTRPLLLHIFKMKNLFSTTATAEAPRPISDTLQMLADSCIAAARSSVNVLSHLYIDGSIATYGFFDCHHLFSATLILIISAIIGPNSSDSDAVQTSFHLLQIMRDKGNVTASQHYSQLARIQWSVGRLRARANGPISDRGLLEPLNPAMLEEPGPSTTNSLPQVSSSSGTNAVPDLESYDWNDFLLGSNDAVGDASDFFDRSGLDPLMLDPLDHPLLETFLAHTDGSWDDDWSSMMMSPEQSFTRSLG
jgi:proline utilization trans-activator